MFGEEAMRKYSEFLKSDNPEVKGLVSRVARRSLAEFFSANNLSDGPSLKNYIGNFASVIANQNPGRDIIKIGEKLVFLLLKRQLNIF